MRVLHTSDWHIGRRFKGVDLFVYQRRALEWLIKLIENERVDVLCVSGDVYDLVRPASESVRLFDDMFERLGRLEVNGCPLEIVFTPGNHDSAARLGVGAGLMRANVHMRCSLDRIAEPVLVERHGERLAVYALPYLDPDTARSGLQSMLDDAGVDYGIPRSHEGMMRAALTLVTRDLESRRNDDPGLAAVLMAHAFVMGAAVSDSERSITVGGVDGIPAGLFSHTGIDYLALGHLHRPQRVSIPDLPDERSAFHCGRTPQANYSGSLLAYSFSESRTPPAEGNGKSVTLIDVDGSGAHDIREVPVESGEPALVCLEGTQEEILGPLADLYGDDWASVTVHVPEFPHGLYQKIDARYAHALEKSLIYERRDNEARRTMADLRRMTNDMDVLCGFVRYSLGRDPDEAETAVLRSAAEHVRETGAEHAGSDDGEKETGR